MKQGKKIQNLVRQSVMQVFCAFSYYCFMAFACSSNLSAAAVSSNQSRAMDLHYGTALYHYYQNDWYEALLALETYDTIAMTQYHGYHPRLVKAGIMLSYGMPSSAQSTIENLLSVNETPDQEVSFSGEGDVFTLSESDIDYAQFALLKAYYEQGQYAKAASIAANFDKIPAAEPAQTVQITPPYQQELYYLQGQLQLVLHRKPELALMTLQKMDVSSTWYRYLLFNLSVQYLKSGDLATAEGILSPFITDRSLNSPSDNYERNSIDELSLLNDRLQSLWVLLLKRKGDHNAMLSALEPLHLQTGTARQLLLLYTRELVEKEHYGQAAQVLNFLLAQMSDASANLDILYLQARLQDHTSDFTSASKNYSNLAEKAEKQLRHLVEQMAALDETSLTTYVDGAQLTFYTNFYQHYHSSAFQDNLEEYQTLLRLQKNVSIWLKEIEVYRWVLDEKQTYWLTKASAIEKILEAQNTVNLTQEREVITSGSPLTTTHTIEDESLQTYAKLANEQWHVQFERLEKAKILREAFSNQHDSRTTKWDNQLKRAQGLLLWQGSESWPKNVWQHTKLVKQVDEQISLFETNRKRLQSRLKESESIVSLSTRLSTLTPKMIALGGEIEAALVVSVQSLRGRVRDYLVAEQASAKSYLKLGRVALATLAKKKFEHGVGAPGAIPHD